MANYMLYQGVCRDCTWNGRTRRDGSAAVDDAARHNMRTDHTWNVLEAQGPKRANDYGWRVTNAF